MPHAENTDAAAGTTTFLTPSSCAKSTACIPPPPPNAINTKSRGSKPLLRDTSLRALIILLFAILIIPLAASEDVIPNFFPTLFSAELAAFMSALIDPPQK